MTCPCINCEKKGCEVYHDKCELYKTYKEDKNKINKKRQEMYRKIIHYNKYDISKRTYQNRKLSMSKFQGEKEKKWLMI